MAELGDTTDPAALVPGDPEAVQTVGAAMARLGAALVGAGDALRRIDTGDWQGEAAETFRRAFDPVPAQWTGTGEAFLEAADALADHVEALTGAQGEALAAAQDWDAAQALSARPRAPDQPDPGTPGRAAATERLRAARAALADAGDRAAPLVGYARDLAPPLPSVAQQVGGFLGDLGAGAWSELTATGRFLWQVDPARFLVEPAEAVEGWQDLGVGVARAVAHPAEAITQALDPREAATNPTRWAGEVLTGLGLSGLAGSGAMGRVERATRAAQALPPDMPPTGDQDPRLGRYRGLTAAEHAANEGALIGRHGSARSMKVPTRELDTSEEVDEVYRALTSGGQIVRSDARRVVALLEDGTYVTWRPSSGSTPGESAVTINGATGAMVKVHTPRGNR
jgi:hypothetical protein